MTYRVEFEASAAKALSKFDRPMQNRLRGVIELLAIDPRPPAATKLVGADLWRVRTGDYRVVYAIEDDQLLVLVVKVAHRRQVYDR